MGFFKRYIKPSQDSTQHDAAENSKNALASPMEMVVASPPSSSRVQSSRSSQPSSLYPEGDFRNASRKSVIEVKSNVVVNWVHQQQREKFLYSDSPFEGVVLKQMKDQFVCAPDKLKESVFFKQVAMLNVKVSLPSAILFPSLNDFKVCYDSQDSPC